MIRFDTIRSVALGVTTLIALTCVGSNRMLADSLYRQPGYVPSELPSTKLPTQLATVGITEKLGQQIDLDLTFIGEDGYPVKLRQFFGKDKPVILDLVYYNCPQLCTLILNSQVQVMKEIPWTPGKEYEIVTISIDPRESFDIARKKKDSYLFQFGRPAPGWHFLTDYGNNVQKLADQVGFHYKYDATIEQYAHQAAIMVLTPEGKMARYLYGIDYKSRDMRFALAEASAGRPTMALEKILLFCYHYDPGERRYVAFALTFMSYSAGLIALIFAFFWIRMIRSDKRGSLPRTLKEHSA